MSSPPPPPPPTSPPRQRNISRVHWGIPSPTDLENNLSSPTTLGASYVRKQKKNLLEDCREGNPVVLWEGGMRKLRRYRGGFVNKFFTLCAVVGTGGGCDGGARSSEASSSSVGSEEDAYDSVINVGFTYRDNYMGVMDRSMKGVIGDVEKFFHKDRNYLPEADGGLVIHAMCKGKYKKYVLCCSTEEARDEFISEFHRLEELLKVASNELGINSSRNSISEGAANGAREMQDELVDGLVECLVELKQMHDDVNATSSTKNPEYSFVNQCLGIYGNIKEHMAKPNKDGASLQIKGLVEVVKSMKLLVAHAKTREGRVEYLHSEEYMGGIRKSLAFAMMVANEMQFGMNDKEMHQQDRQRVRSVSTSLLDAPEHLGEELERQLSPTVMGMTSALVEPRYSSRDSVDHLVFAGMSDDDSSDFSGDDSEDDEMAHKVAELRRQSSKSGRQMKKTTKGAITRRQTGGGGLGIEITVQNDRDWKHQDIGL